MLYTEIKCFGRETFHDLGSPRFYCTYIFDLMSNLDFHNACIYLFYTYIYILTIQPDKISEMESAGEGVRTMAQLGILLDAESGHNDVIDREPRHSNGNRYATYKMHTLMMS